MVYVPPAVTGGGGRGVSGVAGVETMKNERMIGQQHLKPFKAQIKVRRPKKEIGRHVTAQFCVA